MTNVYPAPKKSKAPWIVGGVILGLLLLCGVGSFALLAGTGAAVNSAVSQASADASDRAADVKITSCENSGYGTVSISFTVVNSSDQAQSYLPEFDIISKEDDSVIGTAADVVNELAPGKTYKGKAVGTLDDSSGSNFACSLKSA